MNVKRNFSKGISSKHLLEVRGVEHDPVPDRDPTGFCNSKPDPDWTGFRKYLYRIGYGNPSSVDHCSRMLNQRVFQIKTGLDQIFG